MHGIDHKTGRTLSGWALFVAHAIDVITTARGSRQKRRLYGSRCPELLGQSNSEHHQMLLRAYVAQAFIDPVNGLVGRFTLSSVDVKAHASGMKLSIYGLYLGRNQVFEVPLNAH